MWVRKDSLQYLAKMLQSFHADLSKKSILMHFSGTIEVSSQWEGKDFYFSFQVVPIYSLQILVYVCKDCVDPSFPCQCCFALHFRGAVAYWQLIKVILRHMLLLRECSCWVIIVIYSQLVGECRG
ncbi:hypothetical protein KIL84_023340 [Mauremys mutica]|uniref:Uncharacterized protein n=1 Tax=Mauremys mutica TaxID=74926 RepID=A0A9D4ARF2_9SAUR|nr:hypothetical protein KIL84_023340 [Mauremys mutica]